jgi:molybdate transport system permease protein
MQKRLFRHRMVSANSQPGCLFVLPSLILIVVMGMPIFALLWRTDWHEFPRYALSEMALTALGLSLITSLLSVAIAILAGSPLAYVLARWDFRGRAAFELLTDLPVVLPPSAAGLALLLAFGRMGVFGGWLNVLGVQLPFSTAAVVIAQTFVSASFYIRSARVGFASVEPQLEEAAHVEGASQWQIFWEVMLPQAWRALVGGAVLAWTRALGEFGATILFAGNLQGVSQTMPLAIYLGFERDLGVAMVLAVELVLVSLGLLALMRKLDQPDRG